MMLIDAEKTKFLYNLAESSMEDSGEALLAYHLREGCYNKPLKFYCTRRGCLLKVE